MKVIKKIFVNEYGVVNTKLVNTRYIQSIEHDDKTKILVIKERKLDDFYSYTFHDIDEPIEFLQQITLEI